MRPLVAVPGRRSTEAAGLRTEVLAAGRRYFEALHRAGAEGAVLLPAPELVAHLPEVLARFDGVLLLGGGDVDPEAYGASDRHPALSGVDRVHDAVELATARAALAADLPVLAVCRGLQVLNVALGGTLHQHLDDNGPLRHRRHHHPVAVVPGCRLALATRTLRPVGHSVHHQAIDRLAEGLVVTARADDGTIEAVERPDGWVVGVQWHPEDTAAEDPAQQAIFDAFAEACRSYAAVRR